MTKAFETATAADKALCGADILDAFENVRVKAEDLQFKNNRGVPNVVARVRKTRKGKKGCGTTAGTNGSTYYVIRLGGDGVLYCTHPSTRQPCPSFKFKSGLKAPATGGPPTCKHVRALLEAVVELVNSGVNKTNDMIIYNARAIIEAAGLAA